MKKLNIFLCVCAVAAAGIMISCKNEATEYVDITKTSEQIYYKVSGTIKNTKTEGAVAAPEVIEDVTTIDGTAFVTHSDSEMLDSNYSMYDITIYDEDAATVTTITQNGTSTKTKKWKASTMIMNLTKIDGSYYFFESDYCKYDKVTVTGSIGGKEFKLSADLSCEDDRKDVSQAEKDNPTQVEKSASKMDLTFTRIN